MMRSGWLDWQTPPVTINAVEARFLLDASRSGESAAFGSSTSTPATRLARALHRKRAVDYVLGRAAGWGPGMWAAYLTCAGFNALWRHHGDIHADGCGAAWQPDGNCSGCGAPRRLDALAWEDRVATLDDDERSAETARTRLWCVEHGFIRARDVTTQKVCMTPGSPIHDGGLARV